MARTVDHTFKAFGLRFKPLSEQIENLFEFSQNPAQRVRTGLSPIDKLCGGPAPGEVFMFVGRSFAGKSIVGQNIIWHNRFMPSIFFSLEMPYMLALQRLYSIWSDTNHRDVQEMTEAGALPEMLRYMADDFLLHRIVDTEALSLDTMSLYLEAYDGEYGHRPEFVVVDYLELVGGAKKSGDGWTATEVQSTSLKDWAKKEEMRVFVLHQANKEEAPWRPPTESSPRGGGYTEADFVVGMWQPSRDPELNDFEYTYLKDKVSFNVLKNRAYGDVSGKRELSFRMTPSLRLEFDYE